MISPQQKHTEGPWRIVDGQVRRYFIPPDLIEIENAHGGLIACTYRENWGLGGKTDRANALLIAAAPELLAALEGILFDSYGCSLCDSGRPRNSAKGHQPDCPFEIAHAAIAKATDHPQQQEQDSMSRLLAEIAEQEGAVDECDFYDPSDRF